MTKESNVGLFIHYLNVKFNLEELTYEEFPYSEGEITESVCKLHKLCKLQS